MDGIDQRLLLMYTCTMSNGKICIKCGKRMRIDCKGNVHVKCQHWRIITERRLCKVCGKPMKLYNRTDYHTKCKPSIFNEDGSCKICGKSIPVRARGLHSYFHISGKTVWSKGLTKETHPSLINTGINVRKAKTGTKAPWSIEVCRKLAKDPKIRQKAIETRKRRIKEGTFIPYNGRQYGNGNPPPPSEIRAMEILIPLGFIHQYVVGMGKGSSRPHHYKLDFGLPSQKIGIEIDGSSHYPKDRQKADKRKDFRLKKRGWTILRFPATFDVLNMQTQISRLLR